MNRTIALILLNLVLSTAVLADVAGPEKPTNEKVKKPAAIDTTLSIALSRDAKDARLIIPRSQLKQLRADLELLDADRDHTASAGVTKVPTIVSGALLSLAFVLGGFWLIKPGRLDTDGSKTVAAAAILLAGGAFATMVLGNAGPPAEARSITGKMFTKAVHMYGFGSGKIKLEVSDVAAYPKLIVPNPVDEAVKTEE